MQMDDEPPSAAPLQHQRAARMDVRGANVERGHGERAVFLNREVLCFECQRLAVAALAIGLQQRPEDA